MRILLSCLQAVRDHTLPPYRHWENYFRGGIAEMNGTAVAVDGIDWVEALFYEHDPAAAAAWRANAWSRVLEWIDKSRGEDRPDLFLSYLYPWMVDRVAIREIQRRGVPCVNFFCDNVRLFVRVPEEYGVFDLHWVPELAATQLYADARLPFIHAAMPVWVPPALRTAAHAEEYGPTFIGSRDAQREVLFADAIALGARLTLRGMGWPLQGSAGRVESDGVPGKRRSIGQIIRNNVHFVRRFGVAGFWRKMEERLRRRVADSAFSGFVEPPPTSDEYIRITQTSRIILGVNRYPSYRHPFARPDTYSRARDIEAPMMGACYLTEWTPELPVMYDLGTEVETYRDARELVERIRALEAEPSRRRSMRRAAQARALADHSVPRSLERIAERLSIAAPTRP